MQRREHFLENETHEILSDLKSKTSHDSREKTGLCLTSQGDKFFKLVDLAIPADKGIIEKYIDK